MKIVVALTGASGTVYGLRLIEELGSRGVEVVPIVSDAARKVMAYELEDGGGEGLTGFISEAKIDAGVASGSFKLDAMVIVPCSMKTLSAVANGYASNLIARVADVMIKEQRRLIIVPRETPLSAIHLENMLRLSRLGVTVLPAMPAFYHKPRSV
ncbi:MAG TPA: UbiX family flavin prenyltransferase, partial [Euryarchaeota archaeon]|nr:UbiX family flavin prenyltransferase [Euryarchaeota archaeon]